MMIKKNNLILYSSIFIIINLLFSNENFFSYKRTYTQEMIDLYEYDMIEFQYNDLDGSFAQKPNNVYMHLINDNQNIASYQMNNYYYEKNNLWSVTIPLEKSLNDVKIFFSDTYFDESFSNSIFYYLLENKNLFNYKFNNVEKLLNDGNIKDAVAQLYELIENKNISDSKIADCKYFVAEIYLNNYNDYLICIDILDDVIHNYHGTMASKKALFTKAYIYANYLDYYTDAINAYNKFLNLYPSDELIPSINYELEFLLRITTLAN